MKNTLRISLLIVLLFVLATPVVKAGLLDNIAESCRKIICQPYGGGCYVDNSSCGAKNSKDKKNLPVPKKDDGKPKWSLGFASGDDMNRQPLKNSAGKEINNEPPIKNGISGGIKITITW